MIIDTVEGLFGEKIHYDEQGNKVGESWPGLFGGSWDHYDSDGNYIGRSDVGLFADQVHYDSHNENVGYSNRAVFGGTNHYSSDGYAGYTRSTIFGEETDLEDDIW